MKIQPGIGYTFDSSAKGFTLDTSEQFPTAPSTVSHPFKIVNAYILSSKVRFQVVSGAINNLVPLIDDIGGGQVKLNRVTSGVANPPTCELSSTNYDATTKTSYIVLRSGPSASTGVYPDSDDTTTRYPVIIGGTDPVPVDLDTWGFVILGTITVDSITAPTTFTVSQNVTGSLWSDRIKLGTLTASYYYARI